MSGREGRIQNAEEVDVGELDFDVGETAPPTVVSIHDIDNFIDGDIRPFFISAFHPLHGIAPTLCQLNSSKFSDAGEKLKKLAIHDQRLLRQRLEGALGKIELEIKARDAIFEDVESFRNRVISKRKALEEKKRSDKEASEQKAKDDAADKALKDREEYLKAQGVQEQPSTSSGISESFTPYLRPFHPDSESESE